MIREELIDILPLVRRPTRYIDGEINSIRKDLNRVRLRFALTFPDLYEIGMSHLGIQILYSILNSHPEVACERVFSPGRDMEEIMRDKGTTLSSMESSLPLKEFDVIGFSLQYELSYTNLLNILNLSGIPFYSKDRDDSYPLIMGGGPVALNPEPVADFFDALLLGDGEEAILEIVDVLIEGKDRDWRREEVLERLSQIKGIYVPSYFDVKYNKDGRIEEINPDPSHYKVVERRVLGDLDRASFPVRPVVPYLQTIHNRLSIEIARGCTRGCRFCQAGFVYRPIRERSPETVLNLVRESLRNTGYDEVSLLSLSTGDYTSIQGLIPDLMEVLCREKIALSFPSLRVGSVSPLFMEQVKRVRKTGFTLAPEAGTPRLRRVINKEMDEEELKNTVRWVFDAGWRAIKLYFMIGLPTEEDEDLMGIVDLSHEVLNSGKTGKVTVKVNVSTFVPKAHTPFQWSPQITAEETIRRQNFIRGKLRRGLEFKRHDPMMSLLEGVFSRGDRRLSRVIHKAYSIGCRLDGWSEHFRFDLWQEAFKDSGLDIDFYLYRQRDESECLPWHHLNSGVSEEFLIRESRKALGCEVSDDCRIGRCEVCGVCDPDTIKNIVFADTPVKRDSFIFRSPLKSRALLGAKKVRIRFSKTGEMRFLSHLELISTFSKALRRADIPVKFSKGFHPLPKLTFGEAIPVGMESLDEYVDVELERFLSQDVILDRLRKALPEGIRPLDAEIILWKTPPIPVTVRGGRYVVSFDRLMASSLSSAGLLPDSNKISKKIDEFIGMREVPFVREKAKGERVIDLRPFVKELSLIGNAELGITLGKIGERMVRPTEIAQNLLGLSDIEVCLLRVLKRETIFKTTNMGYQELERVCKRG